MEPYLLKSDESREYFFEEGCHILELSNSRHDPHLSIARARLAPGRRTRLHKVSDTVERYVILEGEGLVEIGNLGPIAVTRGDVAIIPSGCPQRIHNRGDADLVFLAICTPRFLPENYQDVEDA